jgi:hypothetical protein
MRYLPVAAMILLSACGGGGSPGSQCQGDETCLTNWYFKSYQPLSCPANTSGVKVNGKLVAGMFQGQNISESELTTETHGLQRYFAPYELWFIAQKDPEQVPLTQVMNGNMEELENALVKAGINPNATLSAEDQAKATKIIGEVLFAPLRSFVQQHSTPAEQGKANLVILEQVVDKTFSDLLLKGGEIAGMGISKTLIDAVSPSDSNATLYNMLGISSDFTPTLFVGHKTIMKYTQIPDTIVAHEMGHALGLQHLTTKGNLMYPQANAADTCPPVLTTAQADGMVGLEKMAAELGLDAGSGLERALSLHQAVVDRLLKRNK